MWYVSLQERQTTEKTRDGRYLVKLILALHRRYPPTKKLRQEGIPRCGQSRTKNCCQVLFQFDLWELRWPPLRPCAMPRRLLAAKSSQALKLALYKGFPTGASRWEREATLAGFFFFLFFLSFQAVLFFVLPENTQHKGRGWKCSLFGCNNFNTLSFFAELSEHFRA